MYFGSLLPAASNRQTSYIYLATYVENNQIFQLTFKNKYDFSIKSVIHQDVVAETFARSAEGQCNSQVLFQVSAWLFVLTLKDTPCAHCSFSADSHLVHFFFGVHGCSALQAATNIYR